VNGGKARASTQRVFPYGVAKQGGTISCNPETYRRNPPVIGGEGKKTMQMTLDRESVSKEAEAAKRETVSVVSPLKKKNNI